MISESQRLQYLEAMGIQAWISRERASAQAVPVLDSPDRPEPGNPDTLSALSGQQSARLSDRPASFEIGPGSGSTLLLCNRREDAATPLASDIARCLDEAPVWGWIARDQNGPDATNSGLSLDRAINERLFTRVLLFCGDSGAGLVGQNEILSSARIIHAPSIAELSNHPAHKSRLWMQLLTHGWCARQG